MALMAENIHNLGGRMSGNAVAVTARTDLNNLGGQIGAANSLNVRQ
jgi:filamentous hemagglutinin